MILLRLLLRLFLLTESEGDGGDEGNGDGDGTEGNGADEASGSEGSDANDSAEGGDQGKDPQKHIANLEDKVRRLAMKLDKKDAEIKKRDRRIKELEDQAKASGESQSDELRSARLHNQFLQTAIALSDPIDVATGWDLMTARGYLDGIKDITEDAMAEALDRLTSDYPWLAPNADVDEEGQPSPLPRTRNISPSKEGARTANSAALRKRFPALRRSR